MAYTRSRFDTSRQHGNHDGGGFSDSGSPKKVVKDLSVVYEVIPGHQVYSRRFLKVKFKFKRSKFKVKFKFFFLISKKKFF